MTSSLKKLAVITGASSGIGYELAKQFAENGYDLIIAAQSASIVEAAQAFKALGAEVTSVQTNLGTYEGIDELWNAIAQSGRHIDAAAINAGVGLGGAFTDTDLETELNMIDLNVTSTVHLAKHLTQHMVERGEGRILFTASIAGTMPAPFEAVYGATKAFVRYFGESLRNELQDTGVSVTVLMPGPTETNFFHRANMDNTKVGASKKDSPADVARDGFKALMDGDEHVFGGGIKNKIQGNMGKILPDAVKASMHRGMAEPGSADRA